MTIRNLNIDTIYGQSVQATVCEITGMRLGYDPVAKTAGLRIDFNVYASLADAAASAAPLVSRSLWYEGVVGSPEFVMGQNAFDQLRSWLYDQIQEEPDYASGTQNLD